MSVLKIDSSARFYDSKSRVLTEYLATRLGYPIVSRDLSLESFPAISAEDLMDMHQKNDIQRKSLLVHEHLSSQLINEVKNAEIIIGIPASLKHWVDYIVRSKVTFEYGENDPKGLSGVKKAFIVTSSGGTEIGGEMDFASPYMEKICRFIGVKDVFHIKASGSKRESEEVIAIVKQQIDNYLKEM